MVGNSCELKNALLFNEPSGAAFQLYRRLHPRLQSAPRRRRDAVQRQILPGNVTVEKDGVPFDTGLRKFGALIGDGAEIGCNSVLNPGSIIGRGAMIYPG